MGEFIWMDYLLLAVVFVSAVISIFRGFFKEALSLASWVIALWLAWKGGTLVAAPLEAWVSDPALRLWLARGLILVVILLSGGIINKLVSMLMESSGLTGTDRAIGMVFGLARGVILAGLLVAIFDALGFSDSAWWGESKLIPYAAPVADFIRHMAEDGLDYLGGVDVPSGL